MEKMDKEANVLSVNEQLETEKQEKIDEVIQNAKNEENDLQLETMAAPTSPKDRFDLIWDRLEQLGDKSDKVRTLEYNNGKKDSLKLSGGVEVRDINITGRLKGDENIGEEKVITAQYYYKVGDQIQKKDYDILLKDSDGDGNEEVYWRDNRNNDKHYLKLFDTDKYQYKDLKRVYEILEDSRFEKVTNEDGSFWQRIKPW